MEETKSIKAPISVCLICKNEGPRLAACLSSFEDYVEEIIVVITGGNDDSIDIAKKYTDKVFEYNGCNDPESGLIDDFADARNYSFSLASQPWVMWVDADDTIRNAHLLKDIVAEYEMKLRFLKTDAPIMIKFPYEYAHDEFGNCTTYQWRERLISNKSKFKWTHPIHEWILAEDPRTLSNNIETIDNCHNVVFVHNRRDKAVEANRNLRIVEKYLAKHGESEIRILYYAGLEYGNVGNYDKMIEYLTKYIERSGWSHEQYQACIKLGRYYLSNLEYDKCLEMAFKAASLEEKWGEAYFLISQVYFLKSIKGIDQYRNAQRSIHFAEIALNLPPTNTLLFVNPMERKYEYHNVLNIVYSIVGDINGAIRSAELALQARPDDQNTRRNLEKYKRAFHRLAANKELQEIMYNHGISEPQYLKIMNILDGDSGGTSYSAKKNIAPKDVSEDSFFGAAISPHSQAWAIPEENDKHELPAVLSNKQLESSVILIWKQYILHDEILAAISFLENAPVEVRHNYAIEEALRTTEQMVNWIKDPKLMEKFNTPGDPMKESGVPLPGGLFWQEGNRFDLIKNHLDPAPKSLVDFGCMDGCFTNRYGLLGYKVIGLDLCHSSVALANSKSQEFGTGAKHVVTYFKDANEHVEDGSQDYVTTSDSYEHLLDPITEMFKPARKMLNKKSGKFLLVTPYKSWMRGKFVPLADPWVNGKDKNEPWNSGKPRNHLVAPTQWSVVKQLEESGFYVDQSFVSFCSPNSDVPWQGNVFVESWLDQNAPKNDKPLDIIFFVGNGLEQWTPESIKVNGIGGSEYMESALARGLAKLGHKVRVYYGTSPDVEGIFDGARFYTSDKFRNLTCDVLVVSRFANMLNDDYNVTAKIKLLHCHDVVAVNASGKLLLKANKVLGLSRWHVDYLQKGHNLHSEHLRQTRNGIYCSRFENKNIVRNPKKIVVTSSPDRGWDTILDIFPKIKEKVPDAELHLFYGFNNAEVMATQNPGLATEIQRMKNKAESLAHLGVHLRGRVNQNQLADEMLSAGVWTHLTWFTESSCISAMEALAAGCRVVCTDKAALSETASIGALIEGDCFSEEYREKAVSLITEALDNFDQEKAEIQLAYAKENFEINTLVSDWEKMFHEEIEWAKTNPMPPYQPTPAFVNGKPSQQ